MTIYQFCKCTNKIFYKIVDKNNTVISNKKLGIPVPYLFNTILNISLENMNDYDIVVFKISNEKNNDKNDIYKNDLYDIISNNIILNCKKYHNDKPIKKIVIEDEYMSLYD